MGMDVLRVLHLFFHFMYEVELLKCMVERRTHTEFGGATGCLYGVFFYV